MQRLHLVRHGQIPSNVSGALDTAIPGPALTDVGNQQARDLVARFDGVPIDSIWTSTALRTQQTAQPLAAHRGLELNILDELREISAGSLEMSEHPADRHTYLSTITSWIMGDLDVPLAGGTTGFEVLERCEQAFEQIAATGAQHAVVVAHGALISFWAGLKAKNLTEEHFTSHPVVNTGIATLTPHDDAWRALHWMGVDLA